MASEAAKTDRTVLWERTGWDQHLVDRDMQLVHQTRLPDEREAKLQRAVELTELLIDHSVQGLNTLALLIRRWLRSLKMQEV